MTNRIRPSAPPPPPVTSYVAFFFTAELIWLVSIIAVTRPTRDEAPWKHRYLVTGWPVVFM